MARSAPSITGFASSLPRAIRLGVEHPHGIAVVHSLGRQGVPCWPSSWI